jgi:hypothetical protein
MEKIDASVGFAGGKPCYNIPKDQEAIQRLLSQIPASQGGCVGKVWKPAMWGVCAPDLAEAIRKFQEANRAKLAYSPDGHVDPGGSTLALLNALASGTAPAATGLTQSALAMKVVGQGISWCQAAINAIQTYGIAFATGSEGADSLVAKALNVHFHLDQINDRSKSAGQMDSILDNFKQIKTALMSPSSSFNDITTSESAAIFGKSGEAGWVPPPAFVWRKDGKKWIFFTPSFQEWSVANPSGYGPNARTAMVVHEAGHYIDDSILDYAYEWTSTSAGTNRADPTNACVPTSDPKCLYYAGLPPQQALNNAACYPTFAAHILRKFDSQSTRYGAGNPTL